MTLMINNDHVSQVLTMKDTIGVLEDAYQSLAAGEAVCRPRIDIQIPTSDPRKAYQWGTMEGGKAGGYFAIRMKSDVVYETEYNGVRSQEKYCKEPGLFCGLILLTSTENGEPLAFINDGVLQHMRVGADGGIGVKYMSREDSQVVGMLGSGGMAETHIDAFMCVRDIKKLQVFSPTKENRERFGDWVRSRHKIEVEVCDTPEKIYKGADIVAGCTDSAIPVIDPSCLEPGQHVLNVGARGMVSEETQDRVDVYFRFGNAPAPEGLPEFGLADEFITYAARRDQDYGFTLKPKGSRGHGIVMEDRIVYFKDFLDGTNRGRLNREQITYSERGNLQGNQFHAVAGRVYELARDAKIGNEIPTEWLLQDIRD